MKRYVKLLIVAVCSFFILDNVKAQKQYPLDYSPELLLGKWTATSGSMTYEVELTMQVLPLNNDRIEYILGKITYKKNGSIIRKTEYNDVRSIIAGIDIKSNKKARLDYYDEERLVWWKFDFTIDENNSNRAVWKFVRAEEGWQGMGWNKENMPDIPDNLVFTKRSAITPGGSIGDLDSTVPVINP